MDDEMQNELELVVKYRKELGLENRSDLSSIQSITQYLDKQEQDLATQNKIISYNNLPKLGLIPLDKPPTIDFTKDTKLKWEDGRLDNLDKDGLETLLAKKQISNLNSQDFINTSKKYNVPLGMLLTVSNADGIADTKSDDTGLSKKNLDMLGKVIQNKYLKKDLFDIESVANVQKNPDTYKEKLNNNYQNLINSLK